MTTPPTRHVSTRAPATPEDINAATLLGICASMKPAPGHQGHSAARSILSYTLEAVSTVYPDVFLLDLRNHPLPFFDGRLPDEHEDSALRFVWSCVDRAGALLIAVPAYWCGISGVFKNFVDVLCGPIYDLEETAQTVFMSKPVGLLIVGADDASAQAGLAQAQQIMGCTGAQLIGQPVVVSNPRASGIDERMLSRELIALGAELARHAYLATQQETPDR